jgi:D-tyrosyl-tRNA(Tyr) deacylase
LRALIQRVSGASVRVAGETVSGIGPGLVVLLGVAEGDGEADAAYLTGKIANLRIFSNEQNRFNRSALDTGAELLVVSQFTLYGDVRKGRRPSFSSAAKVKSQWKGR